MITDDGGDLEFKFQNAVCMVRARAFRTPNEKARFVDEARRLATDAGAKLQ